MFQVELPLVRSHPKLYDCAASSAPHVFLFTSSSWEFCWQSLLLSALGYNLSLGLGENIDPGVCQPGAVSCPSHLYTPSLSLIITVKPKWSHIKERLSIVWGAEDPVNDDHCPDLVLFSMCILISSFRCLSKSLAINVKARLLGTQEL